MNLKRKVSSIVSITIIIGGLLISNTNLVKAEKQNIEDSSVNQLQFDPALTTSIDNNISAEEVMNLSTNLVKTRSNEKVLIHNNGKPISGSIIEKANNGNLYAIYLENVDGVEYRGMYSVSTGVEVKTDDLEQFALDCSLESEKVINEQQSKLENGDKLKAYTAQTHNWGSIVGKFSWRNNFVKKQNSTLNGKSVSVWDITSFNQAEMKYAQHVYTITRLDANQTNQQIMSYGPKNLGSGASGSFSLSGPPGAGSASISYSFSKEISVDDLSSLSNKYGRWKYKSRVLTKNITSDNAIRVTNGAGKLLIKSSHSVDGVYSVPVYNNIIADR